MADGNDEAANAPLMRESETETPYYPEVAQSHENDPTSPSAFVWALTFSAGISGLLFGYEYDLLFFSSNRC